MDFYQLCGVHPFNQGSLTELSPGSKFLEKCVKPLNPPASFADIVIVVGAA
jgi:hypothetical protein